MIITTEHASAAVEHKSMETVLSTVNAPYGVQLDATALAEQIALTQDVSACTGPVFAFFSEIPLELQLRFIDQSGLEISVMKKIAQDLSEVAGYDMPLGV